MKLLHEIATWTVALIGTLGLILIALWLLDKLITEALQWLSLKRAFVDFCFNRKKCRCGAVWPLDKALPK